MGRRTRYQTFDVPQLVVDLLVSWERDDVALADSMCKATEAVAAAPGAHDAVATLPASVPLGDDNILIEGGPATQDATKDSGAKVVCVA